MSIFTSGHLPIPGAGTILVIVLIGLIVLRYQGAPLAAAAAAIVAVTRAAALFHRRTAHSHPRAELRS